MIDPCTIITLYNDELYRTPWLKIWVPDYKNKDFVPYVVVKWLTKKGFTFPMTIEKEVEFKLRFL